jgi:hypothetical protein
MIMLYSYFHHLSRVLRGSESLTTLDGVAAGLLITLTITTALWWWRRRREHRNFARTCRARGLSVHETRHADLKDKDGRLVGTRQIDCWRDPKFKVLRQGKRVVGIRVTVPPGVGRERVETARDDLGSVFGLDFLPPERDGRNHNTYTFHAANFGKKPGVEGGWV